jgi:DNA-binding response OmpR family regulator
MHTGTDVAVSAGASETDAVQSLAAGATAFLPKPIDFWRLLSQVAALLNVEWSEEVPGAQAAGTGPNGCIHPRSFHRDLDRAAARENRSTTPPGATRRQA